MTISTKIAKAANSSGGEKAHFPELKAYYNQLAGVGTKLAGEAPAEISADAKKFGTAVNVLNDVVKKASSSAEIQAKAMGDPKLKAATTDVTDSVTKLVAYRSKSC